MFSFFNSLQYLVEFEFRFSHSALQSGLFSDYEPASSSISMPFFLKKNRLYTYFFFWRNRLVVSGQHLWVFGSYLTLIFLHILLVLVIFFALLAG